MVKELYVTVVAIMSGVACAGGESGIYVEFYNPGAPYHVAPDGWQTVPNFPCRHGPDTNNDGIPESLGQAEPGLPSGSNVNIFDATGVSYRVFAWNGWNSYDIGNIYVSAGSSEIEPKLFVGMPSTGYHSVNTILPYAACKNLGAVNYGNGKMKVHGYITGNMTGSIRAHQIQRFDFGTAGSSGTGTIIGDITNNPSADASAGSLGGIYAKRVAPGAVIKSYTSDIANILIYQDFEGSVHTNSADLVTCRIKGDFIEGGGEYFR